MSDPNVTEKPRGVARSWVQRRVRRMACFFQGHPCEPTGRHAILLVEWKCKRCGGLYVSHAHHGNALMDADDDSDRIFRDCMDAIKAADAYPPNAELCGQPPETPGGAQNKQSKNL